MFVRKKRVIEVEPNLAALITSIFMIYDLRVIGCQSTIQSSTVNVSSTGFEANLGKHGLLHKTGQ